MTMSNHCPTAYSTFGSSILRFPVRVTSARCQQYGMSYNKKVANRFSPPRIVKLGRCLPAGFLVARPEDELRDPVWRMHSVNPQVELIVRYGVTQ
jgi:hypothetical protein